MSNRDKFSKGNFYHIYNRGVEKRDIFLHDNDRWRFLQGLFLFNDKKSVSNILWQMEKCRGRATFGVFKDFLKNKQKEKSRKPLVRILADCLMPNHFHLLLEEIEDGGISKFMHKLGGGYTGYFNNKYNRVGSLFQGGFKSSEIEDDFYLKYLLVYINVINPGQLIDLKLKEERNKIDLDKILKFVEDFLWSTHQEYIGKRDSIIIDKGFFKNIFPAIKNYEGFVKDVLLNKFEDMDMKIEDPKKFYLE